MELIGELQSIIYRNDINGYTIAEFETQDEATTIVGYLPFINPGDNLKLEGNYVEHKEYGMQFKINTFEKLMPQTIKGIEKYLASGNIKGVGEVLAKRIVKQFKEETIEVLKNEPYRLEIIKGISKNKAIEISESFIENWEVWQIVGFLEKFGIGAEYAKKVFDLYGVNAIQQIEEDPYLLLDVTRGIDFKQIDKMALDLGLDYTDEKRIQSGIKYGLIRCTNNGHSCVLKENLINFVEDLLNVSEEHIDNGLIDLKVRNEIVVEKREKEEWVYLDYFYNTEEEIAFRILRSQGAKNVKKISNIGANLEKVEKTSKIELSEKQKEAINLINENNVVIITGGPGTGKTTIIKSIIDIYEEKKYKVVLCAPTRTSSKKNDRNNRKRSINTT